MNEKDRKIIQGVINNLEEYKDEIQVSVARLCYKLERGSYINKCLILLIIILTLIIGILILKNGI